MSRSPRRGIIVAGGGTAGHVLPALAVADALVVGGVEAKDIHYVGSSRGIEARLVPEAGYRLTLLGGRGIQRSFSVQNIRSVAAIVKAIVGAFDLVRRERPGAVLAVGGYASVPCVVAAWLLRVPIIVAEQNAVPGMANRCAARVARAAAVSFPGTPLPRAVVTGNPVRAAFAAVDRSEGTAEAKQRLGVPPERALVLVVGGSLGALTLNRAALSAAALWADRSDLAVHHVVGSRDWSEIRAAALTAGPGGVTDGLWYRQVEYESDMVTAMAAADVIVCRAGSSTCFEVAAVGLPAVLVPSPYVTGDHQRANAAHLRDAGAAVVVEDAEMDGERLRAEVDALLGDPHRLEAMGKAAAALARPDAAAAIAALVKDAMK